MSDVQLRLFPEPRPLLERFGAEFFRTVPRKPGVYLMSGEADRILYIGKAKDLRLRLASYKYPQSSRKVQRLGWRVRAITWEICADRATAGVRENQLLRLHKPIFNVLNTRSEHYPFIGLRRVGGQAHLRITKTPTPFKGERLYGAFKGLPLVRSAFAALLRLLWTEENRARVMCELPWALLREHPPSTWSCSPTDRVWPLLTDFLEGTSDGLLDDFASRLSPVSIFEKLFWENDFEVLREFYARGPKRNRELRDLFDVREHCISQPEIDDLLVLREEKTRCADQQTGLRN